MIEWIIPLSIIGLIIFGMQIKNYTYPSQIQKEFTKDFNKQWEQIKMTEKRFNKVEVYLSYEIFDNKANEQLDVNKTVDLLNSLDEENTQLKKILNISKNDNVNDLENLKIKIQYSIMKVLMITTILVTIQKM